VPGDAITSGGGEALVPMEVVTSGGDKASALDDSATPVVESSVIYVNYNYNENSKIT